MTATIELEPEEVSELKQRTNQPDIESALREVASLFLQRDKLIDQPNNVSPPSREDWLRRLDQLRDSIGTEKQGTPTEAILDDLRADRQQ